jgi:hypothetical protein
VIRAVIDEITIAIRGRSELVDVTVGWAGGQQTHEVIRRPIQRSEDLSYYPHLAKRITELAGAGWDPGRIADQLNTEGFLPARGAGPIRHRPSTPIPANSPNSAPTSTVSAAGPPVSTPNSPTRPRITSHRRSLLDKWRNKLHWVRDVSYGEDASQIRTGNGPQVMATLPGTWPSGSSSSPGTPASQPPAATTPATPPGPWTPSASACHDQNGHHATLPEPWGEGPWTKYRLS